MNIQDFVGIREHLQRFFCLSSCLRVCDLFDFGDDDVIPDLDAFLEDQGFLDLISLVGAAKCEPLFELAFSCKEVKIDDYVFHTETHDYCKGGFDHDEYRRCYMESYFIANTRFLYSWTALENLIRYVCCDTSQYVAPKIEKYLCKTKCLARIRGIDELALATNKLISEDLQHKFRKPIRIERDASFAFRVCKMVRNETIHSGLADIDHVAESDDLFSEQCFDPKRHKILCLFENVNRLTLMIIQAMLYEHLLTSYNSSGPKLSNEFRVCFDSLACLHLEGGLPTYPFSMVLF